MDSLSGLSLSKLNAVALDRFVLQPVRTEMIKDLAEAAISVAQCDPNMMHARLPLKL